MTAPAVSVLMPFRDAASTLREALESVLAQRDVALELVAIDDGSKDEGPAIVHAAAARDDRVTVVSAPGRGIAAALASGLDAARADVVARMDADDLCRPTRFAKQLQALRQNPSWALTGTRVATFPDEAVGEGMRRYVEWQNQIVSPEDHRRELFVESPLCHPSVMIRRSVLHEVGPWRETDGPEDYDLWLRIAAAGYAMAKVPEVLLDWRHVEGRATFSDPRYAIERFTETKAPHLARVLRAEGRPVVVWGAGQTGKRAARALEPHGVRATRFVDIDAKKIGRTARGVEIVPPTDLRRGEDTVVVAVGARGARQLVRDWLTERQFVETVDFWCAA